MKTSANPAQRWQLRKFTDSFARHTIRIGGISVIIAIVLMFAYLLSVVMPIFYSAEVIRVGQYPQTTPGKTLAYAMEDKATVTARFSDNGNIYYIDTHDGKVIGETSLPIPSGQTISTIAQDESFPDRYIFGFDHGSVLLVQMKFNISYPNDVRTITPELVFPIGEELIQLDEDQQALSRVSVYLDEDAAAIAGLTNDHRMVWKSYSVETSMMDEQMSIEEESYASMGVAANTQYLLMSYDTSVLYSATDNGDIHYWLASEDGIDLQQTASIGNNTKLNGFDFLLGRSGLLASTNKGEIQHWFPVRNKQGRYLLQHVRSFSMDQAITQVVAEPRVRGFLASDAAGNIGIFHTTAERELLNTNINAGAISTFTLSPRGKQLLAETSNGKLLFYDVHNEHPEISWSSLWQEVWYEGYPEPDYTWQSSSASNDFEPKFSLVPLTFGTLKAAFYAMLFAMPLAIMGAAFAAQFMTSRMRKVVKPTIEIMEALPTVILGFLAGLWLAPFAETHLPGLFSLLMVLPIGFLLISLLYWKLPLEIRNRIDGWEAALLLPVVVLLTWLSMAISMPLEQLMFGGNIQLWMSQELGIDYDQRNSLIVGIAMGFAVIPTIFSISEDALFSVPSYLVRGSLALGATPWQTLIRVVLPTASPAIFSAVMMGFGRAVGETMIVLMATGNTPIMDFSVFEGMRTLSANIAVEMPEAEVASTHFRVLFLAALVLFGFTFIVNSIAEIVRQRLRKKYSSL